MYCVILRQSLWLKWEFELSLDWLLNILWCDPILRWCHGVSHLNCCCWRHQWERGRRSHVIQENSKENVIICQLQTNVECILYAFYVESCKHTNITICNMIELLAATSWWLEKIINYPEKPTTMRRYWRNQMMMVDVWWILTLH